MATTATGVATLEANAGGRHLRGEIMRDGQRFVYSIDHARIASARTLAAAAHRLAAEIRERLPRHGAADWGVEVHCSTRPDVGLLMGNRPRAGGGGGAPNPCVLKAIRAFERGDKSLASALEVAARLLADCCD